MKYSLIVRTDAEAELAEACTWYEEKRAGLGKDLLMRVDAALKVIKKRPLSFPLVHELIRRALVKRFPYAVYFIVEGTEISVISILHVSRDPKRWQNRA